MPSNEEILLITRGLDELLDALDTAPELAQPLFEQALQRSLLAIGGRVAEYPPESEANRPRSWTSSVYSVASGKRASVNTWYERGYGPKWVRKDGTINGRKTSRFLGRQWTGKVTVQDGTVVGVVGNSAPYAPYVQGRQQADFHARRGWLTLDAAVVQSGEDIDAAFGDALSALIQALAD